MENLITQLREGRLRPGAGLTFGTHRQSPVDRVALDVEQLAEGCHVGTKPDGTPYRFLIKTYGCQMNEHDTEVMAGLLLAMGYQPAAQDDEADFILFNTCAVRENAEDKVFGEIGRLRPLKAVNPELVLGLCGCMAQEKGVQQLVQSKFPWVDVVFGTHNIHRLPKLLTEARNSRTTVMEVWDQAAQTVEDLPKLRKDKVRAWVNIQYGCNKFCTYCIVPYTRGSERSRLPEDILAEVRQLAAEGFKEITLLGQNVNDYGVDLGHVTFAQLLREVNRVPGVERIRFTTSNPWNFTDDLIAAIAECEHVAEHIHLPVQSGNNQVLKRMNRTHTREFYLELVAKIRAAIPNVVLTTDIIVGFPGETEAQFQDTLSLVEQVQFDNAFTFIYSPRENTPAAGFADDTPLAEKKNRLYRLNALQYDISRKHNEALRGQVLEVLVEGPSKTNAAVLAGRTRSNKLVLFEGDPSLIGQLVQVQIVEPQTWTLKGTYLPERTEVLA
ncbi:tRNA (N6-isopentenyl adenosine(37)-C2)-methylthiotransferase MiaB [Alicyclobacillus cycloheptanicus]|uniref:tRNA-2-methylthio-N(6)-dimethylallyladenosine synthase n=1 Tax=Alicyclobacillus cycloheptanicus TaxID=1457 RepID=A0ABT9XG89_9BACL|nr:tRNA (N6-isopentenyl adenosine(37)-C2)-methylthiotransferase MiaB [Alicyclobacillus cycloheptanicus]MDQ0189308.1 tRNA-2-methylthio-N6-dimethylallyladenosine synthase [Alicyclobacillus cycloheptanicus]WDM01330.1 tRNA (N6-isopentenyl adenosine(37)-C2)-methylthiotransferase MiaB [Alicyclobacillus cycloheptanicus]